VSGGGSCSRQEAPAEEVRTLGSGLTILLEPVGEGAGFDKDGEPFWREARGRPVQGRVHIAFGAENRATVDAFYVAAIEAGGIDNGAPGVRAIYHPNYYGTYVLDPRWQQHRGCLSHAGVGTPERALEDFDFHACQWQRAAPFRCSRRAQNACPVSGTATARAATADGEPGAGRPSRKGSLCGPV
jgi:hypothetical protein